MAGHRPEPACADDSPGRSSAVIEELILPSTRIPLRPSFCQRLYRKGQHRLQKRSGSPQIKIVCQQFRAFRSSASSDPAARLEPGVRWVNS
jgi:hypothetical protein